VSAAEFRVMKNTYDYLEFADPKMDFHLMIPDHVTGPKACKKTPIPDWARLICHQCSNCKLTGENAEYCPPAYDMIDLVEHFASLNSYETVRLHMWKNGEMHTIQTDLQRALSYLFPAILAASSCPYAELLSPTRKFGKPFPDLEDFLFYSLSFGLISSYLEDNQDPEAGIAVPASNKAQTVAHVFHGLLRRIKQSSLSDAIVNALVRDIQWSYLALFPKRFFKNKLEKYFAWQ
jgi:hypothetical protein